MFLTTRYRDVLGLRIDAVLDDLGNRLEWIALRERNNPDRVPVIPDFELPAFATSWLHR